MKCEYIGRSKAGGQGVQVSLPQCAEFETGYEIQNGLTETMMDRHN